MKKKMKNQGYLAIDLVTVFLRCNAPVQARALGKGKCVALVIQNTFNLMDGTANTSEVMIGSSSGQPHQLVPGERSELIYTSDLENVWIRVRDTVAGAGTPVDVSVLVYKEKE